MGIPPIPPSPPPDFTGKFQPPLVAQLYTDWDDWWTQPTAATGGTLLTFLVDNQTYFTNLGNSLPCPFPKKADQHFLDYYKGAINYLQGWISHGSDPSKTTPVSEWINDIYVWVDQTAKPPPSPLLAQLYIDWDNWSNQPTAQTAASLILFLTTNEAYFMELGNSFPCPFPKGITENFATYFNNVINDLQNWTEGGCDPAQSDTVSNALNAIYAWMTQKS